MLKGSTWSVTYSDPRSVWCLVIVTLTWGHLHGAAGVGEVADTISTTYIAPSADDVNRPGEWTWNVEKWIKREEVERLANPCPEVDDTYTSAALEICDQERQEAINEKNNTISEQRKLEQRLLELNRTNLQLQWNNLQLHRELEAQRGPDRVAQVSARINLEAKNNELESTKRELESKKGELEAIIRELDLQLDVLRKKYEGCGSKLDKELLAGEISIESQKQLTQQLKKCNEQVTEREAFFRKWGK